MPTLALHEVTICTRGQQPICTRFSMEIQPGQCWGILGRNGVGKTTLLKAMAGLLPVEQGRITLSAKPLAHWQRRDLAREIGILLPVMEYPFPWSLLAFVLNGRYAHRPSRQDRQIAEQALVAVDLVAKATQEIQTLSSGEKQRAGLAMLLAQDPWLMLLDEAVEHLDLCHRIDILNHLIKHCHGERKGALCLVLHDLNLAMRYCDHLLYLFPDGQILHGPKEALLQEELLNRLFGYPLVAMKGPIGNVWLPA